MTARPRAAHVAVALDTALDLSVVGGYTRAGLAVRRRLATWPADPAPGSLAGRRALVTGASSGLGTATAAGLAGLGAHVHLVVRDVEKGERTARAIEAEVPGARLSVDRCDVADLDDVRRLATDLRGRIGAEGAAGEGPAGLDVVVHNAGAMPPVRTTSPQGRELTMALHVLGPVLMTDLLRPVLAGRAARVLLVTSGGMYAQVLRADDPDHVTGDYSPTTAYARSKRAQVELLGPLAQRWADDGIAVHAVHPGWADTPGVVDALPGFHRLTGPLLRDAAGGADTAVWLAATQPPPPSGRLWHDRRARPAYWLGRRRAAPADVERMWHWVRDAAGLA